MNTLEEKIRESMEGHHVMERMIVLGLLWDELRKSNSIRMNNFQMGRKVEVRPDEIALKGDMDNSPESEGMGALAD